CDLMLLPLTDGVSTKRGTLMAALAHGVPVVGLQGTRTDRILRGDALTLTPAGDPAAFARAAVALAGDPAALRAPGEAGGGSSTSGSSTGRSWRTGSRRRCRDDRCHAGRPPHRAGGRDGDAGRAARAGAARARAPRDDDRRRLRAARARAAHARHRAGARR